MLAFASCCAVSGVIRPVCTKMCSPFFLRSAMVSMYFWSGTSPVFCAPPLMRRPVHPFCMSFSAVVLSSCGVDMGIMSLRSVVWQWSQLSAQFVPVMLMFSKICFLLVW